MPMEIMNAPLDTPNCACSWLKITCSIDLPPRPPYSLGQVIARPAAVEEGALPAAGSARCRWARRRRRSTARARSRRGGPWGWRGRRARPAPRPGRRLLRACRRSPRPQQLERVLLAGRGRGRCHAAEGDRRAPPRAAGRAPEPDPVRLARGRPGRRDLAGHRPVRRPRRGASTSLAAPATSCASGATLPPGVRSPTPRHRAGRGVHGARPDLREARPDDRLVAGHVPRSPGRRLPAHARRRAARSPPTRRMAIVEDDLGAPAADLFAEVDPAPLSAASIAQVHALRAARRPARRCSRCSGPPSPTG